MMIFYLLLGLVQATTKENMMDQTKANVELDTEKDAEVSMHDEGEMDASAGDLAERIDKMFARMDKMQAGLEALVAASEREGATTPQTQVGGPELIPGARIQPDHGMTTQKMTFGTSPPCLDSFSSYNRTHPCVRSDCQPSCQMLAKATCRCEIAGVMRVLATREGSPGNPGSCGFTQMDMDRTAVPTLCVAWRGSPGFTRWSSQSQDPPMCATCEAWPKHRTTPTTEDWLRDTSAHVGTWGPNGIAGPTYHSSADGMSGSYTPP